MFEVNNGVTKIDGSRGKYTEENVTNPSVRYGRNAVQNFYSYMEHPIVSDKNTTPPILDFGTNPDAQDKNIEAMDKYTKANDDYLKSLPPLEYEYRYMPNIHKKGEIDKNALLGAAYEEMGGRKSVQVKEIDQIFGMTDDFTSASMDLNKDGKIDLGEYSTSILASDMLSKSADTISADNIDGTINQKGHNAVQEYAKKSNAEKASMLYGYLYDKYNLYNAAKDFNEG